MTSQHQQKVVADGGSAIVVEEQQNESTVQTVLRGIAAAQGTPERELDALYDSIEPEALNELMRHSQRATADVSVTFTYEGFTVQVQDGEPIKIMDLPPDRNDGIM